MAKRPFDEQRLPAFDSSPPVVLVCGDVSFFVEEATERAAEHLLGAPDTELLEFEDDAAPEAIADALLNRSLFSPRRVVRADVSRLLGSEKPAELLRQAVEAWTRGGAGGRREAFRAVRAYLSALDVPRGDDPTETAEAALRKTRSGKDLGPVLVEILRELPPDRGTTAVLAAAVRRLLQSGNDGVVALLTAVAPPAEGLAGEIANRGLLLEAGVGANPAPALGRLARARAREHEVALSPDAIQRLLVQTNEQPDLFAAELAKLLDWAGKGGKIEAGDVRRTVEDESAEDVYEFLDALGRRDAGEILGRLERLLSGRDVTMGRRDVDTDEYWPTYFLSIVAGELRRMLYVRAVLDESAGPAWETGRNADAFFARFGDRLEAPVAPFGRAVFGKSQPYLWFKVAQRAKAFTAAELARALSRAAETDALLKNSGPPLETLSSFLGELVTRSVEAPSRVP